VTQVQNGGPVVLGPDAEAALAAMDDPAQLIFRTALRDLGTNAGQGLMQRPLLEFLRDHPLESPTFDPEMLRRHLDGLPADHVPGAVTRVRVYLLDRDEVLRDGFPFEIGEPRG
jgi:hypothetical protein